jgi:hypothetical protein
LAFVFVTATAGIGIALYPEYRARVRPHLFDDAPSIGWLFERKEHLAFGALLFAWTGTAAYFAARRAKGAADAGAVSASTTSTASLGRAAFVAFALSAAMALLAAALGVAVAATRTF